VAHVTGYEFNPNGTINAVDVRGMVDIQALVDGYFEIVVSGPGWCLYGNETARIDMLSMNEPARRFIASALNTEPGRILSMHGVMVLVGNSSEGETIELTEAKVTEAFSCRMYDEGVVTVTHIGPTQEG
jgi:hypothetical protein